MSNDENKSLQQNLPLSWEEDSQNNIEEQLPPKKLLLRKDETNSQEPVKPLMLKRTAEEPLNELPDEDQADEENTEDVEETASRPLMLKRPSEEPANERVYRSQLDNMDTIYDKEIPDDEDDESTGPDESDSQEEDVLNEESGSYFESIEEDWEDDDLEDEEEIDEETSELAEEAGTDEQESVYDSAFEDSGTFTLDETSDDEDDLPYGEEEIDEDRISIPQVSLEASADSEQEIDTEEPMDEESIFALKAETYYNVQTENGEDEDIEPAKTSEVIQDIQVQSLGALLQEARLGCSFTIKDAAEATRIKSSYIIALESNEMDELPAKVYVLNYIRQLCREYNVPNEPMLKAFENQSESNANGHDVKIMRVGDEDARKATKPGSKLNALLVGTSLLTLIMLFLIGWYMKWINPTSSPENVEVDVNLEEVRPEVKLPAPELPIPTNK